MRKSLQAALESLYGDKDPGETPGDLLEQHGILLLVPRGHETEASRQFTRAETMKQDFLDVTRVLSEGGIPFVPLKGLLLADLLYGDYALRGSADIDLAVPLERYDAAVRCLTESGNTHFRSDYNYRTVEVFSCAKFKTILDVHFALSTAELFSGFMAEFWENQDRVLFEGRSFAVPSREVNLTYLLIHLARHIEEIRAIWIEDIRRFLVKFEATLDWNRLLSIGNRHRLTNALMLSMSYCNRVFEDFGRPVRFPPDIVEAIRRRQTLHGRILYRYLLPRLASDTMTSLSRRMLSFSLNENRHERYVVIREFFRRRLRGRA